MELKGLATNVSFRMSGSLVLSPPLYHGLKALKYPVWRAITLMPYTREA